MPPSTPGAIPTLAQGFPFRFLDQILPGEVRVRLTSTAASQRGLPALPNILLLEILAQAAQALLAEGSGRAEDTGKRGSLAAMDNVRFSACLAELPLLAGQTLRAQAEKSASFGRLIKIHGKIFREVTEGVEEEIAEADLMLSL